MGFTRDGRQIGNGTYGIVYSGEMEHKDGRKEKGAQKQAFYKHNYSGFGILREIQMARELSSQCKFFPRLLDVSFADYERKPLDLNVMKNESVTFVTELLEMDGAHFFRMRKYDLNTVIELTSQLLLAIGFMHSKFITHRDIKPSNILISTKKGRPMLKVCDFGFSQYLINSATSTPETNTPWYRAPEIMWGIPKYGDASDVWAVGATIYEMLTGKILMEDAPQNNAELFNETLRRIPNEWTSTIHSSYIRNTNTVLKVNGSTQPCSMPPGASFMETFIASPYYRVKDHDIWVKFDSLLRECFNYDYKNRVTLWELLNRDLFNGIRSSINQNLREVDKPKFNDNIVFNIPTEYQQRKVTFFNNFLAMTKKFSRRQLFHAIDLGNRILERLSEFDPECNVEKVLAACIYFYHKFFLSLIFPEDVRNFFYKIVDTSTEEKYYELDRWIYNFEQKIIMNIFPTFKFYRPGLFEMSDDYSLLLDEAQFNLLLNRFINLQKWECGSYRKMFREFYHELIDPNHVF